MIRGAGRRRRARLLTAAACVVFALGGAEPALAHVDLVEVEPALGAVLETTPAEVTMRFSGQVNPAAFEFHLFHRDGRVVPFTGDGPVFDGTAVTIDLPALDLGTYVVVWSSTGLDGHLAAGQTHFSIGFEEGGSVADLTGDSRGGGTADNLVRWALSGALALAIGLLWLRASGLTSTTGRIAKVGCAAFLLALLRLILVAGRVGGGHLDGLSRIAGAGPGRFGWTLLLGGTLLIWLARRPMLQLAGVVASAAGSILAGHLANQAGAGLLVALGAAHLLGAVFWIGAPAAALLWARQAGITAFARRFTPWAAASVIVLATSGIGLSVLRTAIEEAGGLGALASYRYGTVLLAKWAVLVLVVVPLGAYHLLVSLRGGIAGRAGAIAEESDRTPTGPAPEAGTGRGRRLLRAEVAGLAAVIGLGTILGGLSPARSEQLQLESGDLLAAPASFESCTSGQSQTDQFVCVVRYFEHVAGTDGMPAALKEVTERWVNGDSWMQLNCHAIGHKLGRLGYRIYKDVPTAFEAGSDPCDYGYLHGVIEGASADFSDDELRAAMTKLCDGTGDPTIHTHRQCIHGLGHAAARRVNNDLPRAMEFCREFYKPGMSADASKDLESLVFTLCVTGVSMEWNTQPKAQEARNLPIGHPDTLLGQCAALETIFQNGCVEYGTSSLGGIPEREIEARDWCDANLDDPLPCYQSIGRDVIWSPLISDEEAMAICMGGRPGIYAEQCITRALGSVATISLDASSIDEFCPVVPEQYQYLCPIVRDAMAVQIEQTTRGFITEPGSGP